MPCLLLLSLMVLRGARCVRPKAAIVVHPVAKQANNRAVKSSGNMHGTAVAARQGERSEGA